MKGVAPSPYLGHHGRLAVRDLDQNGQLCIATDVVILRRAFVFQVLVFQQEALNCRRYVCGGASNTFGFVQKSGVWPWPMMNLVRER